MRSHPPVNQAAGELSQYVGLLNTVSYALSCLEPVPADGESLSALAVEMLCCAEHLHRQARFASLLLGETAQDLIARFIDETGRFGAAVAVRSGGDPTLPSPDKAGHVRRITARIGWVAVCLSEELRLRLRARQAAADPGYRSPPDGASMKVLLSARHDSPPFSLPVCASASSIG